MRMVVVDVKPSVKRQWMNMAYINRAVPPMLRLGRCHEHVWLGWHLGRYYMVK